MRDLRSRTVCMVFPRIILWLPPRMSSPGRLTKGHTRGVASPR